MKTRRVHTGMPTNRKAELDYKNDLLTKTLNDYIEKMKGVLNPPSPVVLPYQMPKKLTRSQEMAKMRCIIVLRGLSASFDPNYAKSWEITLAISMLTEVKDILSNIEREVESDSQL